MKDSHHGHQRKKYMTSTSSWATASTVISAAGNTESAVMAALKKKYPKAIEIIILSIG